VTLCSKQKPSPFWSFLLLFVCSGYIAVDLAKWLNGLKATFLRTESVEDVYVANFDLAMLETDGPVAWGSWST
jgi:hypothetical protein